MDTKHLKELQVGDIIKRNDGGGYDIKSITEDNGVTTYHFHGFAVDEPVMTKMFENHEKRFIIGSLI